MHWVGASTRPGNGVPLVLIGAMKTAEEALADLSKAEERARAAEAAATEAERP